MFVISRFHNMRGGVLFGVLPPELRLDDFLFNSQVTPGFQGFPQIWGKSKFSIWRNPPDLGEFTFFNIDLTRNF